MAKKTNTQEVETNEVTMEELESNIDTEAVEEILDEDEVFVTESKSAGLLYKAADYLETKALERKAKKAEKQKGNSKIKTGLKVLGGVALAGAGYLAYKCFSGKDSEDTEYLDVEDSDVVADTTYEEISETETPTED